MTEKQKMAIDVLNRMHSPTASELNMLTDEEYMMLLEMVVEYERPKIEYIPYYPYTYPTQSPLQPYYKPYCTTGENTINHI